jgi:hypothetical protein
MLTHLFFFWDGFGGEAEAEAPAAPAASVSRGGGGGGVAYPFTRPETPRRAKKKKKKQPRLPLVEQLPLVNEPIPPGFSATEIAEAQQREADRLARYDEAFIMSRGQSLAIWEELLDA